MNSLSFREKILESYLFSEIDKVTGQLIHNLKAKLKVLTLFLYEQRNEEIDEIRIYKQNYLLSSNFELQCSR